MKTILYSVASFIVVFPCLTPSIFRPAFSVEGQGHTSFVHPPVLATPTSPQTFTHAMLLSFHFVTIVIIITIVSLCVWMNTRCLQATLLSASNGNANQQFVLSLMALTYVASIPPSF
uniref:Uncharacterized protein n=1 Tax=Trypanosoma vivax (strain Y486) TaxID=1055687 RepID=G0UBH6_TRYVY|nr:hypothetical protein TVY486_1106560 [Trypanosoma vivax Y486]